MRTSTERRPHVSSNVTERRAIPAAPTDSQDASMPKKLNTASIQGWLTGHKGWKRKSNHLVKEFTFASFRDSIVFVNRVATLADRADHHPDIDIRFSEVTVRLSTHDAGGITEKDLSLAEAIDFATSAR